MQIANPTQVPNEIVETAFNQTCADRNNGNQTNFVFEIDAPTDVIADLLDNNKFSFDDMVDAIVRGEVAEDETSESLNLAINYFVDSFEAHLAGRLQDEDYDDLDNDIKTRELLSAEVYNWCRETLVYEKGGLRENLYKQLLAYLSDKLPSQLLTDEDTRTEFLDFYGTRLDEIKTVHFGRNNFLTDFVESKVGREGFNEWSSKHDLDSANYLDFEDDNWEYIIYNLRGQQVEFFNNYVIEFDY